MPAWLHEPMHRITPVHVVMDCLERFLRHPDGRWCGNTGPPFRAGPLPLGSEFNPYSGPAFVMRNHLQYRTHAACQRGEKVLQRVGRVG